MIPAFPLVVALLASPNSAPLPDPTGFREVSEYHAFGYDDADLPFRLSGPTLVLASRIPSEARLLELAQRRQVVVEVCRPLRNKDGAWSWPEPVSSIRKLQCVAYRPALRNPRE